MTPQQVEALERTQHAQFRQRAFDHARSQQVAAADAPDHALDGPFGHVEQLASECGLAAERSRLALFMLALTGGPGVFQAAGLMTILGDREVPERIRIREAADLLSAQGWA